MGIPLTSVDRVPILQDALGVAESKIGGKLMVPALVGFTFHGE